MSRQRYTAAQVIEAIEQSRGIKSAIAQRLGCHRHTVDNYIARYPTVARAYWEERERIVDTAEVKLLEKLKDGVDWAIKYVLSTLGKDRGYVERQEVAGEGGGPLTIKVVRVGRDGGAS